MTSANKKHNLARNTTFLTIAFMVQKILSFFYFAFIAQSIGHGNLGKYAFALTFTSIFVIFMDFGLGPILTREGAKDETTLELNLRRMVGLKILLVIGALIALFVSLQIYTTFVHLPPDTLQLSYLASGIIVLDTFAFTFYSIFRAKQRLLYEAIGIIVYQFVIVGAGMAVLLMRLPLHFLIGAILLGSVFQFSYSLFLVIFKAHLRVAPLFAWSQFRRMLKISAPFALAGIFFRLNGSIDTVMIQAYTTEDHVGWYQVAFKLTMALTVLPGAFATSFFPAMSHHLIHAREKVAPVFEQSMFYLTLVSIPITSGVLVLAERFVVSVYGPVFAASGLALQIFMVSLVFLFLNYPVGNFLNAANLQTRNTVNMGIALLINVVVNFFLIPQYHFIGASIAALISTIVLLFLGLPLVYRVQSFNIRYLVAKFIKIFAAGVFMALILYFIEPYFTEKWHLVVLILISAVVYSLSLFLFGALTRQEMGDFLRVF